MDQTSLSLLDRACRQQDSQSWNSLAEVYTPLLRSWLARYGVQDADADDLVQETLVVLARELARFEHNGRSGAFRAWLKTILVNRLRSFWRSRKYRPAANGDSDVLHALDQLADPHSELSRLWDQEHDAQVIRQLAARVEGRFSESTRQAFRRLVFDGASPEAVAQELGLSLNAVVIAKCRVLKALRQEGRGLWGE
jgi:RNA polymerase sigma-70 factor, ECF subfamily